MDVQNEMDSPFLHPHQNIIVEVPVINGEPPAMFNIKRDSNELHLLTSEGTCRDMVQNGDVESDHCKQDGDIVGLQKEEQLRRRREQNRFRMRALRASDSEVAKRLREHNKFRMRTLRASDSLVAQGLRERNKYRMREVRMAETRLIEKCAHVGGCLKKICLTGSKDIHVPDLSPGKEEIRLDIGLSAEVNKLSWSCLENEHIGVQDTFLEALCPKKQDMNRELECSTTSDTTDQVAQICCDRDARPYNCNCSLAHKDDLQVTDIKTNDRAESFEEVTSTNPTECNEFCLESSSVITDMCIAEVNGRQSCESTQYHRLEVLDIVQPKVRNISNFLKLNEEQNRVDSCETIISNVEEQIQRRRERGRLRMRLKRNSETEEEAQRRRERGRLRMRVLRASETEEQAARRRELNRLRMRMKRNTARQ
ncbi:hypothetical protein C0J52_15445 [Blattella germanica]|nr:hypothetical protein C0J52_15445 [Blattella germanica]PSN36965.1 hypothetical protein C0J52_15445 [Blattella germanica]